MMLYSLVFLLDHLATHVLALPAGLTRTTCPRIGKISAGATAPSPPAGVNVYRRPGNTPYTTPESELLASLSFPLGFDCSAKLAILQPGTAVPSSDTFSSSLIPAIPRAAIPGGVDILLVSNPSISLAPAWKTAEYVAYAMDYAELVLERPGTIVAWSQGNLNVQWAFKYWPSTRDRLAVPDRNYVAISADYDGTLLATFLCEPVSIFTDGDAERLASDFISGDGLGQVLKLLGIDKLPVVDGNLHPQAFKGLLLSLVFSDAASKGLPQLPQVSRRDTEVFDAAHAQAAALLAERLERRQSLVPAAKNLLSGLLDPIASELALIAIDPSAPLMQVFANLAKLVTDPPALSLPPSGCAPGVWDQTYFSDLVNVLARDGGSNAYVPTTSVFSLTDEVVEPQGVTGLENASGYMSGSNIATPPNNILIQSHCSSVLGNVADASSPPIITHEGVLNSGAGVAAVVLALADGGTVSFDRIVEAYGSEEACAVVSRFGSPAELLANGATIPGALLRIAVNPGTVGAGADFSAAPVPLPSYAS